MNGIVLLFFQVMAATIALVGMGVMIHGWATSGRDAPVVLSGMLFALLMALLGLQVVKPDPAKANELLSKKEDNKNAEEDTK